MPNWCFNYITVSNDDKKQMQKLKKAIAAGKVLETFIPTPDGLMDGDGWYGWRLSNWGTKWDLCNIEILKDDGESLGIQFSTAWSPPIEAYRALLDMGFYIDAYYAEGGMGFCGYFSQGFDDCYSIDEYSGEWITKHIPQDIIDATDLLGYVYEEED